ncbi:hypothetical protein C7999DRAFT_33601 [Corynascus novoguineensis]|uniref:Uncharacterized protein n=1 Tax=Corynascus novoguineensis TaxID=1126955 RepID=A0AAN7HLQ7_9PEZI|nr:hypothetical protein C7999DRAFT_33601 [Corynascus novoguineensis]
MADIYTPPPDFTYLLLTPFDMPTEGGSVRAVAFSSRSGALMTAALSVAFTVIFICLWNFLCFLFIVSSRNESLSRFVALVTLWNSNDSWFAFKELAGYSYHFLVNQNKAWNRHARYGLALAIVAFCIFGGALALGIVGPSLLQIGTVAPVRPSSVYYPVTPQPTVYVDVLKEFGMRAPGVLRALGSVEAAKVTMRFRVNVDYDREAGTSANGEPIHRLTYNYRLNGIDFGLQQGVSLELAVRGACVTEYGWYAETQRENTDVYHLWGSRDESFVVPIDPYNIQNAPKATFWSHPDAVTQYARDANTSFAIIVWSAHRTSITEGADPWYATEERNSTVEAPFDAHFWMRRARPVLSCWEQNLWSWAGQPVRTVSELKNATGIKIPQSLLAVLEAAFTTPVLIRLGNASGDSALRSRTTSPNGVIDAGASSIHDDLERLILASFVASRNVFVDAVMFEQDGTYPNLVEDATGQPAAGAGDFVVSSPDIQTFSLHGIVVIVVILVVLLLIESLISFFIKGHPMFKTNRERPRKPNSDPESANVTSEEGKIDPAQTSVNAAEPPSSEPPSSQPPSSQPPSSQPPSRLIRFKVLMATQLLRQIYELRMQKVNGWQCDQPFQESEESVNIKWLCDCNKRCNGHMDFKPSQRTE